MATFTASGAQLAAPTRTLRVGLTSVYSSLVFAAAPGATVDSVYQMIKVPAGCTPVYIAVGNTGGGGAHVFSVGDGNSRERYKVIGAVSAGQGQAVCPLPVQAYTYSVDDTIDIFCSQTSAMSLAGTYTMHAIFSMDSLT